MYIYIFIWGHLSFSNINKFLGHFLNTCDGWRVSFASQADTFLSFIIKDNNYLVFIIVSLLHYIIFF